MRLLIVSKRRPQQRDLIERPYGRFYHLPTQLAALGHEVHVMLISHHQLPSQQTQVGGVNWFSEDVRTLGLRKLFHTLKDRTQALRPDWIIGMSDAQYGWLASQLAKSFQANVAVDAYDNYEAYMPWNVPLHLTWHQSLRSADLVTAAGPQLATLLQSHRKNELAVEIISMAADPEFVPANKTMSRQSLGLPSGLPLIGYVGSWAKNRGTTMLIDAFRIARAMRPDLQLVLSGRPPVDALSEPGVIASGYVADAQLPVLINALDVACVITADTRFGRYSYPAKLYEAMACDVPVVATATEPVKWILGDRQKHLTPIGDAEVFAKRILSLLSSPEVDYGPRSSWAEQARRFDYLLASKGRQNR